MPVLTEQDKFIAALKGVGLSVEAGGALLSIGVDTFRKLEAKRGMRMDSPADEHWVALLNKMKSVDSSIDTDVDGDTADQLRLLHIMMLESTKDKGSEGGGGAVGQALTQAAEDAASASKAKELYDKLSETQGLSVPLNEQLDYALVHQMSTLLIKNGTINKRIGLKNMVKQSEKKKNNHKLGNGLSVNIDDATASEEEGSMKYNEITCALWTFFRGLAAVLTEEIVAPDGGEGKTLVTDPTSGLNVHVSGTLQACLELMFAIIKSVGKYPSRCADGIFRNAFNQVMELTVSHHFDEAVRRSIEYHPRAFLPADEDMAMLDSPRKPRVETPRKRPGGAPPGAPLQKKKHTDANAAPCHGQVYHGVCKKEGCRFDHDAGRCAAFKAEHPNGPPSRA